MNVQTDQLSEEVRLWQEKLFGYSIRRRRKLQQIETMLGSTAGLQCLEISAGDGFISARLRRLGGSWRTVAVTETAALSAGCITAEPIALIEQGKLPFEDKRFDRVVITDVVKQFSNDSEFIRECHRVLKPDAWVIITETYRRPYGLVALLQRLMGVSAMAFGAKRNGYTSRELYQILKDGFDVPETISYSNGLLECAATTGEAIQKLLIGSRYWEVESKPEKDILYRYEQIHGLARFTYPLIWILSKFEFMPGHNLAVKSRKRAWRPRLQPKLVDGRSIAEATINTKIGTAAPF